MKVAKLKEEMQRLHALDSAPSRRGTVATGFARVVRWSDQAQGSCSMICRGTGNHAFKIPNRGLSSSPR